MSAKNIIIGVLAGISTGIVLGVGLASKETLTIRKKVIAKGDEYLSLILDKLNTAKLPISKLDIKQDDRPNNKEKAAKEPA